MKRTLLWMATLILIFGAFATTLQAQAREDKDITGNWQGTLQAGQGLRTLIKISKDDGKLKAVMYSIDQGGQPIPITSISLQGSAVNFDIKSLDVTYAGTLNPDGNTIAGSANPERPDPHSQPRARHPPKTPGPSPSRRNPCPPTPFQNSTSSPSSPATPAGKAKASPSVAVTS
ncbi:MAG: hypothetical protein WDN23_07570 [Edaphobacter sp.]